MSIITDVSLFFYSSACIHAAKLVNKLVRLVLFFSQGVNEVTLFFFKKFLRYFLIPPLITVHTGYAVECFFIEAIDIVSKFVKTFFEKTKHVNIRKVGQCIFLEKFFYF